MPGWWMLPFVEVDVKKIVSRVIERARELCISKSFESLGALGISGVLLLTSGGIAWHAIDVLKSFIMSAGGINLGLKFLDSLAGIIISGMILKAGLEIAYQRLIGKQNKILSDEVIEAEKHSSSVLPKQQLGLQFYESEYSALGRKILVEPSLVEKWMLRWTCGKTWKDIISHLPPSKRWRYCGFWIANGGIKALPFFSQDF
ncbi:Metal tolerance protein 2 [Acorus calamus]|uniref:Metal tolerance protein 2 n=1 Tax=Acorus calamus TaxID=4465 RepID=A0AAV9ETD9_ACOCL|nr:Metal tolerance protein 2 [Acorus calamus]